MSHAYRQTISDDMLAAIEARRGRLSLQEFTTVALEQMLAAPSFDDILRRLDAQERQIDELRAALSSAPAVVTTDDMLSF